MRVKCSFVQKASSYKCQISAVHNTKPVIEISWFRGTHVEHKTYKDVDSISFQSANISYFPLFTRRLDDIFPSLRTLEIENSGLKVISREDLVGLEFLEKLSICSNQLRSLPSNVFDNMLKLKEVSFYNNKLEYLSSRLLKPIMKGLILVDFRSNIKIDEFYQKGRQGSVKSIQKLMDTIDEQCSMSKFIQKPSDFTIFTTENEVSKEFHVHKLVLKNHSQIFNDIDASSCEIKEFGIDIISAFIRFMYTGDVQDDVEANQLFSLAAGYKLESLKEIVSAKILRNINECNVLEIFNLGHRYNANDIKKEACQQMMTKIFPGIEYDSSYLTMPEKLNELMEAKKVCDRVLDKALEKISMY